MPIFIKTALFLSDNSFNRSYLTFSFFSKMSTLAMKISVPARKAEFSRCWLENSELSYRLIFGYLTIFALYDHVLSSKEHVKTMFEKSVIGCPFNIKAMERRRSDIVCVLQITHLSIGAQPHRSPLTL